MRLLRGRKPSETGRLRLFSLTFRSHHLRTALNRHDPLPSWETKIFGPWPPALTQQATIGLIVYLKFTGICDHLYTCEPSSGSAASVFYLSSPLHSFPNRRIVKTCEHLNNSQAFFATLNDLGVVAPTSAGSKIPPVCYALQKQY